MVAVQSGFLRGLLKKGAPTRRKGAIVMSLRRSRRREHGFGFRKADVSGGRVFASEFLSNEDQDKTEVSGSTL
jgi:hypothetical protein